MSRSIEHLIRIELSYACGGILVDGRTNKVFAAPPIFRWMIGKQTYQVIRWVKEIKKGKITLVKTWKKTDKLKGS
jgi:hypothetical protein